ARHANHLDLAAADRRTDAVAGTERAQPLAEAPHHVVVARPPHRLLARAAPGAGLRHRGPPPPPPRPVRQPGGRRAPTGGAREDADPAHLGRAAADVDQETEGNVRVEQVLAAGKRQARLLDRRDDLEIEPGVLAHQGEEVLAVTGATAGFGGDVAGASDPV